MEMTIQQWNLMKKDLRRRFSSVGWILLVYYGIMNAAVILALFFETVIRLMVGLASGDPNVMVQTMADAMESGWGYLLAVSVGLLILLVWKKPRFFREELGAKGKPMTPGSFFALVCLFISGQAVFQFLLTVLELILNACGLSVLEGLEQLQMNTDSFSMFLYAGILAPITEEILFRGLIQRSLMPFGRKFAVFCSAFAFGVFHGSLVQSPYAFLVGLILGYVASEYSIAWAMVLHMINNLVIADMLPRLTSGLPELMANLIIWLVIMGFTIGAAAVLIAKRRQIGEFRRGERMNRLYLKCFFTSPGMIVLMVLMGLSMISTFVVMLSPL